ncbi:sialic acid-binding Ig-like lectin 12 [Colossoma macropomum]|uniref:sialic acid-binding Ig-like lectin 12 n=1 Tax=Colossoma macropomum TaxID=42526 RepID=UPI001863A073|nr:sialic acid-binding Ig-like lectin 12 [Colossoma macropomum]
MERCELFLTVSVLSCLSHGWEVQVPESVKAVKGSCVMISCHTSSHSHVNWFKYKGVGYPVVYSRNTAGIIAEFRGRTSVPGSPSQGDCSLKINNVRQEDNGISLYPWIYPETSSNQYKYILINVLNPEVSISVENTQTDGKLFSANCTVQYSCPSSPPPLEWMGLSYISNNVTSTVVSGGLWTLVARAQFRANRLDHNRTLSCNSTFNGKSIYSTTVMLNILFPPSILMNSTCFVSAGGVQCVCRAEAEPQANIFWMVDGSSAVHPHFNTTTTYAGRIAVSELTGPPASNVSCKASNVVGTDTYQMPILHPLSEGSAFLNGV